MDISIKIRDLISTKNLNVDFYINNKSLFPLNNNLANKLCDISIFNIKKYNGKFIYYSNEKNIFYIHKYSMKLIPCNVTIENKLLNIYGIDIIAKMFNHRNIIRAYSVLHFSMLVNSNIYNNKIKYYINAITSLTGCVSEKDVLMLFFVKNIECKKHTMFLVSNKEKQINKIIGDIISNVYEFNNIIINSVVDTKIVDHYVYIINTFIDTVGKLNKLNKSNRQMIFDLFIKNKINNEEMNKFIQTRIII